MMLNFGIGMAKAIALSAIGFVVAIAVIWITVKMAEAHETAKPICSVMLERNFRNDWELVAYDGGFAVGHLHYRALEGDRAVLTSVRVHPGYRTQGVSKALIYGMLMRDPQIKSVGGILISTNFEATGLLGRKSPITLAECENAARRTPFYRALARFGFNRITDCDFDPIIELLHVEVSK